MTWFLRDMVAPDLWRTTEPAVHDFFRANAFTVTGRDADLQVDFLCGFMPLRPVVQSPGKPLIAVATHAHVDHVGGFHEFADRRGPAREAAGFATMAEAWTLQGELRDQREGPAFDRPPHPGFRLSDWALVPAPLTVALDEGDVIDLGDRRFTVLHLPGHSPGSIGLLEERTGLFLSGDAVYDDRLVDDVPGASVPDYLATMDRLRHLDIAIGHGGHGPPFSRSRLVEIAETYMRSKD